MHTKKNLTVSLTLPPPRLGMRLCHMNVQIVPGGVNVQAEWEHLPEQAREKKDELVANAAAAACTAAQAWLDEKLAAWRKGA